MPGRSFAQPDAGRCNKNPDDDAVHRVFVLREHSEWPSLLLRLYMTSKVSPREGMRPTAFCRPGPLTRRRGFMSSCIEQKFFSIMQSQELRINSYLVQSVNVLASRCRVCGRWQETLVQGELNAARAEVPPHAH